jgi:hypothetical protein
MPIGLRCGGSDRLVFRLELGRLHERIGPDAAVGHDPITVIDKSAFTIRLDHIFPVGLWPLHFCHEGGMEFARGPLKGFDLLRLALKKRHGGLDEKAASERGGG